MYIQESTQFYFFFELYNIPYFWKYHDLFLTATETEKKCVYVYIRTLTHRINMLP